MELVPFESARRILQRRRDQLLALVKSGDLTLQKIGRGNYVTTDQLRELTLRELDARIARETTKQGPAQRADHH